MKGLARLPHRILMESNDVQLHEEGQPLDSEHLCWMNTAFVLATRLTDTFAKTGFCTGIHDAEVRDLPAAIDLASPADQGVQQSTEVRLANASALTRFGLLPLQATVDGALFVDRQTVHKPPEFDRQDIDANAVLCAKLPYVMAVSRFAHYLKVIARDKIGSFPEPDDAGRWLNRWIHNYVSADSDPPAAMRAKYPLREAVLEVTELRERPSEYEAHLFIQPWLPDEQLTAAVSIDVTLPSGK